MVGLYNRFGSPKLPGTGFGGLTLAGTTFGCRRIAALALLCAGLAGCASSPDYDDDYAGNGAPRPTAVRPQSATVQQCVPYARAHSGIAIYGDAYLWWAKAESRYARSSYPSKGAVLVLYNYAGPERGHVAVVRDVTDAREIRVDHANWLDDGAIYTDDPVRDVSANNDWSQVRVFNKRTGAWGGRVYPVQGFIGPGPDSPGVDRGLSDMPVAAAPRKNDAIAALLANDDLVTSQGTN